MTTSTVGRVTVHNLWPDCDALSLDLGDGITVTVSKQETGHVHVVIQDDDTSDAVGYVLGDDEVFDPHTGEYSIQSDEYPYFEGAIVVATDRITETDFPEPGNTHIHAETGDKGIIELIDAGNRCLPTVRFHKTGTATIVDEDQIELAED